MSASVRTAVIVLGMHRSGTSAFARVASLLGCDLPKNLMPADKGNDLGHWESNSVTSLNERLLATAGSKWDDWTPLNKGWEKSAVSPAFLAEAQKVLKDEYGNSPLFVLKDPRICRLALLWLKAIKGLGVRPVIAFPLRNPYEVSNSLATRDGSEQGFGLLLWLRHVLEAEAATRDLPRYFFTFEQMLADWGRVIDGFEQETGLHFPGRSVGVEAAISTFLIEDARHERETTATMLNHAAPAWVREVYAILHRWCEGGVQSVDDFARLDLIRSEFDAASPSFARLIATGVHSHGGFGAGANARTDLTQAREEVDRLQSDATQARATLAGMHSEIERLQGETLQGRTVLEEALAEIERLKREEAQSRADLTQAHDEIGRLRGEATDAAHSRATFVEEFNSLRQANHRMEAEIAKLSSAVRQRQEEASQAWAKAEIEEKLRQKADAEQTRLTRQVEELIAQFAAIDERVRADVGALANAQRRASDAETANGQLTRQNERLLLDLENKSAELRQIQYRSTRANSELAQLATLHMSAQERVRELEEIASRVNAYRSEIVALSQRLQAAEQASHQVEIVRRQAEWLQDATTLLQKKPRLRALLLSSARRRYSRDLLKASDLFDPESYLEKNPDVAESGDDPLLHYVRHGLREGRSW